MCATKPSHVRTAPCRSRNRHHLDPAVSWRSLSPPRMGKVGDLEQLARPPIYEVVCGFVFPALALDPFLLGAYWSTRRKEFPERQAQPPVSEQMGISFGVPQVRAWFLSGNKEHVLQIQNDRLYFNWRHEGGAPYPSFSGRQGGGGHRDHTLQEFARFADFVHQETGTRPAPVRADLAKVDLLPEDTYWHGKAELARLLPWVRLPLEFADTELPSLSFQLQEPRDAGVLTVQIDLVLLNSKRAIKVESRIGTAVTGSGGEALRQSLDAANEQLNERVFAELFPKAIRDEFFQAQRRQK